jgi:AcrR family transcriptional regulator
MEVPAQASSEIAILASARNEIERVGILGLRVADVAHGANSSITQIYRFFKNRDGLLARVLGDMYDEFTAGAVAEYKSRLEGTDPLTVDALVNAIPLQFSVDNMRVQELRLQILAVSTTNESLKLRLEQCTQLLVKLWNEGLDEVEARMAPGENFDRRVFLMMLALQNPYYRALIGEHGFSEDEYREFLREKMRTGGSVPPLEHGERTQAGGVEKSL